ncbi:NEFA-interacting nuclear protein NIP30 [Russula compacta]|nr:NEFA-interacting nuclear protein NIP30 [Russula compacta]
MADEAIPSISTGVVGSRFVSQSDIEAARARREEQWKAAYARLGQAPPPPPQEDAYDGRSLAEAAKQEEWEEKTKLANQFRALEEDEIMFLDSVRERRETEERERKQRDGEELKSFRE